MLAIVVLAGCTPRARAWPVPDVAVTPAAIGFDRAIVDQENRAVLTLDNVGTAAVTLKIEADSPFELLSPVIDIAAGDGAEVVVSVRPRDWSPLVGVLRIDGVLTAIEVPLSAEIDADADDDGHDALGAGGDDCDDADPAAAPGLDESCDGIDNDCDGRIDADSIDASAWYPDADGDGYGMGAATVACAAPGEDWALNAGDCDDGDSTVHPGALEIWYDGIDEDCSGGSDFDRDGDGYDNAGTGGDDCVDSDAAVHPGAMEIAGNGVDDDCSGSGT